MHGKWSDVAVFTTTTNPTSLISTELAGLLIHGLSVVATNGGDNTTVTFVSGKPLWFWRAQNANDHDSIIFPIPVEDQSELNVTISAVGTLTLHVYFSNH
jgi:hypothetical protein